MNQLFSTETQTLNIPYLAKRIKVIKKIIENSVFALGLSSPYEKNFKSEKSSANNGFKLHSSSLKSLKSEDKNKLIHTLSESENFFKLVG
jgi:hypothetical protein